MTPEEHKSYEEAELPHPHHNAPTVATYKREHPSPYIEAAKESVYTKPECYHSSIKVMLETSFIKGCEYAEREGYNKALDEVLKVVCMPATIFLFESGLAKGIMIEELKKLRK